MKADVPSTAMGDIAFNLLIFFVILARANHREAADLVFHTMVMLGYRDIPWAAVEAELARRFGIGGHEEKAARGGP